MTVVPKRTDALNALIESANRLSSVERGCTGGPTTEATPPPDPDFPDVPISDGDIGDYPQGGGEPSPPDENTKTDLRLAIIPRGVATRRKSGKLAYPHGGLYPIYGERKKSYLKGFGVDPTTFKADRVRILARVRTREIGKVEDGVWSTLFHLPPGWWPTETVTGKAKTALGGRGTQVLIDVRVTTTGHVQAAGPFHHPQSGKGGDGPGIRALDVSGLEFDAGGGSCPGSPTDDPTAAGDGRSWDSCDAQDPGADPIDDPDTVEGGEDDASARWAILQNVNVTDRVSLPWIQDSDVFQTGPAPSGDSLASLDAGAFNIANTGSYTISVYARVSSEAGQHVTLALALAHPDDQYPGDDTFVAQGLTFNPDTGIAEGVLTYRVRLPVGSWVRPYLTGFDGAVQLIGTGFGRSNITISGSIPRSFAT